MAPVIAACRERFGPDANVFVHTGQHYDQLMSEIFFAELGLPEPDHMLGVGSGGHGAQAARVIERLTPVFELERPDVVVVPGDVNSTLAAALAAGVTGAFLISRIGSSLSGRQAVRVELVALAALGIACFVGSLIAAEAASPFA